MARPKILRESLSSVAGVLALLAAGLALVDDRGRLQFAQHTCSSLRSVGFWLAMAYAWLLVRTGFVSLDVPIQPLLQSIVLVVQAGPTCSPAADSSRRPSSW